MTKSNIICSPKLIVEYVIKGLNSIHDFVKILATETIYLTLRGRGKSCVSDI